jgi:hypothetical protein
VTVVTVKHLITFQKTRPKNETKPGKRNGLLLFCVTVNTSLQTNVSTVVANLATSNSQLTLFLLDGLTLLVTCAF